MDNAEAIKIAIAQMEALSAEAINLEERIAALEIRVAQIQAARAAYLL